MDGRDRLKRSFALPRGGMAVECRVDSESWGWSGFWMAPSAHVVA